LEANQSGPAAIKKIKVVGSKYIEQEESLFWLQSLSKPLYVAAFYK